MTTPDIFEDYDDPRLQPGTLVKGGGDDELYSKRSYQYLISNRTKTTLAVFHDVVRSADLNEKQRDAVDGALMLGAWEFNAPGMNRLGIIDDLKADAEVLARDMEPETVEKLDGEARKEARTGKLWSSFGDLESVAEQEFYSHRRDAYRLEREIARERADGQVIRDYTAVKASIAAGMPIEKVIDELPVYWQKVLVICNVSLAHDNIQSDHVEHLVANQTRDRRHEGSRGPSWAPRRRRNTERADDE